MRFLAYSDRVLSAVIVVGRAVVGLAIPSLLVFHHENPLDTAVLHIVQFFHGVLGPQDQIAQRIAWPVPGKKYILKEKENGDSGVCYFSISLIAEPACPIVKDRNWQQWLAERYFTLFIERS